MDTRKNIENKLQNFIKKFYLNELLKGIILFFSIGILYFFFTLFIEYFLWLKPLARTILFWLFISVEAGLLVFYVLKPISKLIGFKRGISTTEASKMIGNHFPEVNDKLLNMLQLNKETEHSELIVASIKQKSKDLQFVPFKKAIDFSKNKKYLKYAALPILIWFLVFITNNISVFSNSFTRVVKHSKQFEKPAPFTFSILNKSLNVIEGNSLNLVIETVGDVVPENVSIHFLNETYFTQSNELGKFEYQFNSINNSIQFYIEANGYTSKKYNIHVINTPVITNLKMSFQYPKYTGKVNEIIENTGNALVPVGTKVNWIIDTHQTTKVHFLTNNQTEDFILTSENNFELKKTILANTDYEISTTNENLENHEKLNFSIHVVSDEYPKIEVKSNIDSISTGPAQFLGQLSDDYSVDKLVLNYYNKNKKDSIFKYNIEISKGNISDFFYEFPQGLNINQGIEYELFFEVFDNDRIRGSKASKSRVFSYYNKTEGELKNALLKGQKESIDELNATLKKSEKIQEKMQDFKNELQKKEAINWNDTKKLEQFMKRQQQYDEMLNKQTESIKQNLQQQPEIEELNNKKETLLNRIEEVKQDEQQEKLQDELDKLLNKLDKDDLTKKLKDLAKKNQQKKQSLERLLELTKRFYVEQKANQIAEKLEKLAKLQEEQAAKESDNNTAKEQQKLNEKFEEIKVDFKELEKQNEELSQKMTLPETKEEEKKIDEDLKKALEELHKVEAETKEDTKEKSDQNKNVNKKSKGAQKKQKNAARKMKELSEKMTQSMEEMDGEEIDENIDDLRKIVENLIEFSFQQEALFDKFSNSTNDHPEYAKNLKQQYVLKEHFEHIDDSLYVLSLRLAKLGNEIQKEVSNVHFNIDESLENFTDNKFRVGASNQQFVITSANNLANNLSNVLQSLMNASPSFGKGKGKGEQGFSLPDIIKKQGELSKEINEGIKKGEKGKGQKKDGKGEENGEGEGQQQGEDGEMSNEEIFEIYKKQVELKQMLDELMGDQKGKGSGGEAIKQMEEIEKELLEKGFSNDVIDKINKLNHELLKLEEAQKQQGQDSKRESQTGTSSLQKRSIDLLKLKKQYFKTNEILNRQSLPLRSIYKKKVQEYFNNSKKND